MGKYDKLIFQILRGMSDANIEFDELIRLMEHLGFEMRIRGGHHIFRKTGIAEKINLQRQGSKAKTYQVRQVRGVIQKYGLGSEE
jgi:predicted RNA binding protein YcfA (HicA-like mRNA interferase family)